MVTFLIAIIRWPLTSKLRFFVLAAALHPATLLAMPSDLTALRQGALQFVLDSQVQQDSEFYREGEWPSTVQGTDFLSNAILGAPVNPTDDPNAFVIAAIHNILGEIYLQHDADEEILPALKKAQSAVKEYRQEGDLYNFWPKSEEYGDKVHFPRKKIVNDGWAGMLAMPPDADTSSAVQLMFHLGSKVLNEFSRNTKAVSEEPQTNIIKGVGTPYSRYRDTDRWVPHWHNLLLGENNTGAFMTFLDQEPVFPTFVKAFSSPATGPRIPAEKNTVDCVVNSNILRTLSSYDETDTPGYQEACEFINQGARERSWNQCGFYYPQTFSMHYAVANAFKSGAQCLNEAQTHLKKHLLESQSKNGSWLNEVIEGDEIQATALALNALLLLGKPDSPEDKSAATKAFKFLSSKAEATGEGQISWPDGTFFSAGSPLFRDNVLWKSKSYTTAVILQALYQSEKWDISLTPYATLTDVNQELEKRGKPKI